MIFKKIFSVFCALLVLATNLNASVIKSMGSKKETSGQFAIFLEKCSLEERIVLAQSLGYLPQIPKEAFGKLKYDEDGKDTIRLESYESYADSVKDAKELKKAIRPQSFNEIPPKLVLVAIEEKLLEKYLFSPETIKKELLWASSHWSTYLFKSKSEVNYSDIVDWCAKKNDIGKYHINKTSTYELSGIITEAYFEKTFEKVWEEMDEKQRIELLKQIEKNKDIKINNIAGIAAGSAGAALATISATIGLTGFAFYTTMSSIMCSTFAIIGVTLPFSAYITASGAAATLAGPIGWGIAATMILATPFLFGWANLDIVERFVVSKYLIESSWNDK